MLWWINSNQTSSDYFSVRFNETRGMTAVLLTASKNLLSYFGMHSEICVWISLIQTWCGDRHYCILHCDTSLTDLDLDSKSRVGESKNFCGNYQSIWVEFGILLRLVGVMNCMLILFCLFSIQGREPYWCDSVKKKKNPQKNPKQPTPPLPPPPPTLWHWLVFRHFWTDFFRTWCDDRNL